MATFLLRFDLSAYDLRALDGIKIFAEPLTMPYPAPGQGTTYVDIPVVTTDTNGAAAMTLVSLPGLQYRIESWATGSRIISGDWPDGTVLDYYNVASVAPSPIRPEEAAALRARVLAEVNTQIGDLVAAGLGVRLLEVGQDVPPDTPIGTIVYRKTF